MVNDLCKMLSQVIVLSKRISCVCVRSASWDSDFTLLYDCVSMVP